MTFADVLRLALGSVRAHRLRSALTVLGIVIGIASVVLLTSLGEGTRQAILAEFSQFGTNFYIGNHEGATGQYIPLRPDRGTPEYERDDATALAADLAKPVEVVKK